MALDTAMARPRSDSTHFLNFMGDIVFPKGETLSSPFGEFLFSPVGFQIPHMEVVEETRRARLQMLVKKHGSMASLCEMLGYARNETATLTRILNANIRHDRDGKPYNMGSPMARQIEDKLSLGTGWMDTPPTYAELTGEADPRSDLWKVMEDMTPSDLYRAAAILAALKATPAAQHADMVTVQIDKDGVQTHQHVELKGVSLAKATQNHTKAAHTSKT